MGSFFLRSPKIYWGKTVVLCQEAQFLLFNFFLFLFFCRSPNWNSKNVAYEGLDGDKNLYVTFLAASEFIQSAIEKVSGKKCFAFFYTSSLEKDFRDRFTIKINLSRKLIRFVASS